MFRRIADLFGPTPYTGEAPEAEARNAETRPRPDYTSPRYPGQEATELHFVATPLWVVTGTESHDDLMAQLSWRRDQPNAYGKLTLHYRWDALWQLEHSNMSMEKLQRSLKQYTKEQGWNYGGLVDPAGDKLSSYPGIGEINPGEKDWHNKEWSGMEQYDSVDPRKPSPYPGFTDPTDDTPPPSADSTYTCSDCGYPADDYGDWHRHIMQEHVRGGQSEEGPDDADWKTMPSAAEPVVDLDDALPAHWDKLMLDQTDMRRANLRRQLARLITSQGEPTIPGPVPFIFDIEQDRIYVGHPGERHADIQGRFTPGGIVEGTYDPKGQVQLRTDTDMPYTVKHLIQLWYAMHPELEVKGIYLLVGQEKYRLAKMSGTNIGHKVRALVATDPAAWDAYLAMKHFGAVFVVGGAVRDVVRNKTPRDFDLMVQGIPPTDLQEILERLPGRVDVTGKQFGVFRYRNPDGFEVEIALPRKEFSTGEGHRDFDVQSDHLMPIEEDLGRRDFTANAMAVNLDTGELLDPYDGSLDIKRGELKTVSDKSLEEDPLRVLRVLTSIARHGLLPTRELLEQVKENAYRVEHLPAERVMTEMDKMMGGGDPALAIRLLEETGLFKYVLPEYDRTIGFDQHNPHHSELLHDHMKAVLESVAHQVHDPDVRWAALLHDIAKPRSMWLDENSVAHYYRNKEGLGQDHWTVGADMARDALSRLKFPNNRIDRISHLVEHHMFPAFDSERGARKFINRVGPENTDDLLTLRAADIAGKASQEELAQVGQMRQLVHQVQAAGQPTSVKQLAISGSDLIAAGYQPGPQMGATLRYLTERVIDDPELNTPEALLALAEQAWDDQRTANILDPIQTSLDPRVFDDPESPLPNVKPKIIKWVRRRIYHTLTEAGWPDPTDLQYVSLVLTGSLTTYQYTDKSDFDISIWIDSTRLPEWVRADLIRLMIEKCDGEIVPGTTHPMQDFVVDVNRYTPQDLYKPGLRSAYDLDKDVWIVPPDRERSVDVAQLYHASVVYASGIVDKFKLMLKYGNDDAVKVLWDFLHRRRFLDMRAGKGDFAESNIVYKMIANADLLPAISQATGEYIASAKK